MFFAVANYTAFPPVVADLKRLSSEDTGVTRPRSNQTAHGEQAAVATGDSFPHPPSSTDRFASSTSTQMP